MAVVLFDLGNVLVHLRFERALARLAALSGRCSPLELRQLVSSPLKQDFDRGLLDERTFLARLAEAIGAPGVDRRALVAAWVDIFDRWPEAEALLEEVLARGHRAYVLSNTDAIHYPHIRASVPVLARLHGEYLSYEAHVLKPDPAYFQGALAQLGLQAAECVFVDDLAENVAAAEALGIRGVHHRGDVADVRRQLLERLGA